MYHTPDHTEEDTAEADMPRDLDNIRVEADELLDKPERKRLKVKLEYISRAEFKGQTYMLIVLRMLAVLRLPLRSVSWLSIRMGSRIASRRLRVLRIPRIHQIWLSV